MQLKIFGMKYIRLMSIYLSILVIVLTTSSLIIAQPNNLEPGNKFNIEVTAYQASIKINGSTLDLFHMLEAPFDSYVSDKGNIKVKSVIDDSNGNTTVEAEGEFHGKQTVSGVSPVNQWYYILIDYIDKIVENTKQFDPDHVNFSFPNLDNIPISEKTQPFPIFATNDIQFYDEIQPKLDNLISDYSNNLPKGVSRYSIDINWDREKLIFSTDTVFATDQSGTTSDSQNWMFKNNITINVKANPSRSFITSFYFLQRKYIQIGNIHSSLILELGFSELSPDSPGLLSLSSFPVYFSIAIMIIVVKYSRYGRKEKL